MKTYLEDADEAATFRLMDLPPELRLRIYEMHFEDLQTDVEAATQPPITQVSRLVRDEALPLFYQTYTFKVNICTDEGDLESPPSVALEQKPDRFWTTLPSQDLRHVRKLHIEDHNAEVVELRFSIDMGNPGCAPKVRYVGKFESDTGDDTKAWVKTEEDCIQKMLARMEVRPGGKVLRKGDVDDIVVWFVGECAWQDFDDSMTWIEEKWKKWEA